MRNNWNLIHHQKDRRWTFDIIQWKYATGQLPCIITDIQLIYVQILHRNLLRVNTSLRNKM